jgi:hypothetical protein
MTGIEEQILRCNKDNKQGQNSASFFGFYSRVLSPSEKAKREETLKLFLELEEDLNAISNHNGKKVELPSEIGHFSVDKFLIVNTDTTDRN